MKDYRLSEVKKICQTHGCNDCPIYDDCWNNFGGIPPFIPAKWKIDEEMPNKINRIAIPVKLNIDEDGNNEIEKNIEAVNEFCQNIDVNNWQIKN